MLLGAITLCPILSASNGFVLFGDNVPKPEQEDKFVRPLTAPYFHEDSFVTTDVRAWYVNHSFDSDTAAVLNKGSVSIAAVQVRLALAKSIQFVAYKDGYTMFDDAGALDDNEGLNDIGAGIKWAFLQNTESNLHAAVGVGYEAALGKEDVLQNTDEFRIWASVNKGFGKLHVGGTLNYIIAADNSDGLLGNSDIITAHLHLDYYVNKLFSPVVEINGYFSQDKAAALPVSGVDAGSLPGGKSNYTYSIAFGGELRPFGENIGIRAAYETELNDNISLFGDRWTVSGVFEF